MMHFRPAGLLGVTPNDTTLELNVARVPAILVAEYTHESGQAARAKRFDDRRIRRIEPAVAIGHEKIWSQMVECTANRASGAKQRRAVDNVIDLHAKSAAIANKDLYLLPP